MRRFISVLIILPLIVGGCSKDGKDTVVLANVPLHSLALDLCDSCNYYVIVRTQGHMHFYEPTPKDYDVAHSSCAFVKVRGLDEWAKGWRGVELDPPNPHFWLYHRGVMEALDSLSAVLERCQQRYEPSTLESLRRYLDSLFSLNLQREACASSFVVEIFLKNFGVETPCVLQGEEMREPSPVEVENFKRMVKNVGLVVRDTSDVLPDLPSGVRIITLSLHPNFGQKYSNFLRKNVEKLLFLQKM
ncbi:MAG: hypothetical protein GXO39_10115 [Thermotogae bacterium]|nr:hypothetical protein [Thermotogota bacterium]